MNSISAWTITAQSDIDSCTAIFEKKINSFKLEIFNTGDSLWVVANWPKTGRIAFRAAFAMNCDFEVVKIEESARFISIKLKTVLGKYTVRLHFLENDEIVRYTTSFKPSQPLLIPYWPRDIVPLTKNGEIENTFGNIHVQQIGSRSGNLFFTMTKPETGSVFYFQNLTSLSDYCELTETSPADSVGGEWPEIGFRLPIAIEIPLPEKEVIISDAFVILSSEIFENEFEVTQQYLNYVAKIYPYLPQPETKYFDCIDLSSKALNELLTNKGCWSIAAKKPYLNAYLADYDTPPESMVQMAVMIPLLEYSEWLGEKLPLIQEIRQGIDAFYDEKVHSIMRWLPAKSDDLDNSEEQKQPMVMDSWYLHHPMMNLTKLALSGDKEIVKKLLTSLDHAIKIAHHFDYEWPVFYKIDTFEVVKKETIPGKGGEKDVAGSYAHLMLQAWDLTGDKRYFNEALKAAKKLKGLGFEMFYQANNTAFSAGAMLRLYKETKDEFYLNVSYVCLAGIIKNSQLWEGNYGNRKYYPTFFAVFPLNDAPYTAAYEESEVYGAIYYYLKEAEGIAILPSVQLLLAELIKHFANRLPYYYPGNLPQDVLSDEVKTGEVLKDTWIPIEDLADGWEKSGAVGQEVYGAGSPFILLYRQYKKIKNENFIVFIDYPMINFRQYKNNSVTVNIKGDARFSCRMLLLRNEKEKNYKFKVTSKQGKKEQEIEPINTNKNCIEFKIPAASLIKIKWQLL